MDVITLLQPALDTLTAKAEAEPAADILVPRTTFTLVVSNAVTVLRTSTLADRTTNDLMLFIGMMRVLITPHATTFVRLQAITVRWTGFLANGLTEAKDDRTIAGTAHLHCIPSDTLLISNI